MVITGMQTGLGIAQKLTPEDWQETGSNLRPMPVAGREDWSIMRQIAPAAAEYSVFLLKITGYRRGNELHNDRRRAEASTQIRWSFYETKDTHAWILVSHLRDHNYDSKRR